MEENASLAWDANVNWDDLWKKEYLFFLEINLFNLNNVRIIFS